ncbi:unnamed protein product [Vitrella brassicaformis CCMP3155]|uniref:Uncharacterized protein n=3 Tax=Vitrella brassicaformis TaxID=1169539 RepID=A0A0G4EXR7_VITBC|nr:unnamed protein product [Vitrella brassicaformis CCMP3155]|mmetsp:Transcript_38202/g.109053  ORF Transcript_38202/g.109053 Transcript_38202/m.109053 type:complete len:428 (-) Transcript_38202:380-1663(-)|eukprot:CEM03511.1 unnamed protein product [Vitrella brassicaformis CCMP3155]
MQSTLSFAADGRLLLKRKRPPADADNEGDEARKSVRPQPQQPAAVEADSSIAQGDLVDLTDQPSSDDDTGDRPAAAAAAAAVNRERPAAGSVSLMSRLRAAGSSSSADITVTVSPQDGSKERKAAAAATKRTIRASELPSVAPATLMQNVFSKQECDSLLRVLMGESTRWQQSSWWVFKKKHTTPRLSAYYLLNQDSHSSAAAEDAPHTQEHAPTDIEGLRNALPPLADLQPLRQKIEDLVHGHRSTHPHLYGRLPVDRTPDGQKEWHASYVLCNLYRDGQDCVGAHSDHLTSLGPRPLIVSLSFGATRRFRLVSRTEPKTTVTMMLKHGDVLFMWPPAQEDWTHEVPRMQSLAPHPTSRSQRISLTFRSHRHECFQQAPLCHCGNKSIMKATHQGKNRGRYFYSCSPIGEKKPCGFFQWTEWRFDQ